MTWESHLGAGFFGFTPGDTPQPRWKVTAGLDVGEAKAEVGDILETWWRWVAWEDVAPPFAGAVEEWPARLADGLAACRREWAAVQAHHQYLWREEQRRKERRT